MRTIKNFTEYTKQNESNQDDYKTDVIFLIDKDGTDVFAYFPNEEYDDQYKTCYAHVGQHSACSEEYAMECEIATEAQYKELKEEL